MRLYYHPLGSCFILSGVVLFPVYKCDPCIQPELKRVYDIKTDTKYKQCLFRRPPDPVADYISYVSYDFRDFACDEPIPFVFYYPQRFLLYPLWCYLVSCLRVRFMHSTRMERVYDLGPMTLKGLRKIVQTFEPHKIA